MKSIVDIIQQDINYISIPKRSSKKHWEIDFEDYKFKSVKESPSTYWLKVDIRIRNALFILKENAL